MRRAVIILATFVAVLGLAVQVSASNNGTSSRCTGTYLVTGALGDLQLWSFSDEGTIQVTNSAEDEQAFSHGQGAWRRLRSGGGVHLTILDFPVDGVIPPSTMARVDAALTFGRSCATLSGELSLRFYSLPAEDPLNPAAGTHVLTETFTGRLVNAW
jgi:hypothetical protein